MDDAERERERLWMKMEAGLYIALFLLPTVVLALTRLLGRVLHA